MQRAATLLMIAMLAGAMITISASASSKRTVHSFSTAADGGIPYAGLLNVKGTLYGTTFGGGAPGLGTVFSVNSTTGAFTLLHTFSGSSDGAIPAAGLISIGGKLYGTTGAGGNSNYGTVFSLDPASHAETVLYSFKGASDGSGPLAGLLNIGGMLYGTTGAGGTGNCSAGCGTIFAVNQQTGAETVLYSFKGGRDGEVPVAGLINVGGTLYGTTGGGGSLADNCNTGQLPGCGTVFALKLRSGAEKVVYSFNGGSDGDSPRASLLNVDGVLYGTTGTGGADDAGTVFSVDPKTRIEKVIYSFKGGSGDGAYPFAGLINVGGILYGTTYGGGLVKGGAYNGCGTVFSVQPSTEAETVVYFFKGYPKDGQQSQANLIKVGPRLYGTTSAGGSSDVGIVFALTR